MKRGHTETGYDALQMERRIEAQELYAALEEWQETHKKDNKASTVERAMEILDIIAFEW